MCRDPLQRPENLLKRAWECPGPPPSPPTWLRSDRSPSHITLSPPCLQAPTLSFHNNSWAPLVFAPEGRQPGIAQRRQGHVEGPETPDVPLPVSRRLSCTEFLLSGNISVARTEHGDIWEGGTGHGETKMLCVGFLVILITLFHVSNPPHPCFLCSNLFSNFSSLSFMYYFLQNVGIPENRFTDQVILLSYLLSPKHHPAKQIF